MFRIVLAVGLASYVALASGGGTSFANAACSEPCPDDDENGQCPPECSDCTCCLHLPLSLIVAELKTQLSSGSDRAPEQQQAEPESPEPGDILHVPLTALA